MILETTIIIRRKHIVLVKQLSSPREKLVGRLQASIFNVKSENQNARQLRTIPKRKHAKLASSSRSVEESQKITHYSIPVQIEASTGDTCTPSQNVDAENY